MIEHLISCQQTYIIEGVHLMPELIQQLKNKPYWKEIHLVYLIKTDLQKIKDGFGHNTSSHDWLAGALENKKLIEGAARMVQSKSLYIADQAKKYGFKVANMDKNFDVNITKLSKSWGHKE